jgi:hypothetical protein
LGYDGVKPLGNLRLKKKKEEKRFNQGGHEASITQTNG